MVVCTAISDRCRVGAHVEAREPVLTTRDHAWRPGVVTDVVERTGSTAIVQVRLSGKEDPGNVRSTTGPVTHRFPGLATCLHYVSLECEFIGSVWKFVWPHP
jgi:hypothetical protein